MLPHCAAIRHRAGLRKTASSRCIIDIAMSRVPTNRRTAGAMIRSVEGMHRRDATRASPDSEQEASERERDTHVVTEAPQELTPEYERTADGPAPPPGRGDVGRRYDSLVVYPAAPGAADVGKPESREEVEAYEVENSGKADRDDSIAAESPSDDELTRKLDAIPAEPGVYILRDRSGKVLYVGKAKSLR
ncbi:MAG: hypothetical protein QOK03_2900, partial [Candidatus Binataceae bacterium]|nr:hypothetical protein [Candidatus Binataceae bacterium]